MLITFLVY